jgi:hypothetical protein
MPQSKRFLSLRFIPQLKCVRVFFADYATPKCLQLTFLTDPKVPLLSFRSELVARHAQQQVERLRA